jgi:hypothetical protein
LTKKLLVGVFICCDTQDDEEVCSRRNDIRQNDTQRYDTQHFDLYRLDSTDPRFHTHMQNATLFNVMLSIVKMSVVMLSVIVLNVVAPRSQPISSLWLHERSFFNFFSS